MSDLDQMLEQAKAIQDQMASMRDRLSATEVTGTAANGSVRVSMTAAGNFTAVHLDPDLLADAGAEEMEELMLAALRDAGEQLREMTERRMGSLNEIFQSIPQ
ncbi:YbaB/EbfC family nucleoid-associated protein [Paractinoplanes ferrugineus]|uniref:Nucleoid-associated protein Afe05nite_71410 n=1 Tax=Paractinoplanes ferrugineus TaxID=113564 RepID=A0A919MD09_9ACTN|nr:YbaB/EbfC family nucleoid-associated protein [Actinoplanes ferrugineus]GIE15301.1 nucleoid-associated protein [Actinoplanes ferrugineus]